MLNTSLTQKKLKMLLRYNPETGVFIWRIRVSRNIFANDIAGSHNSYGYMRITINRESHLAHRLAWFYVYGVWPEDQLDHINHIRDDNRIKNLREASARVNGKNQSLSERNTSGICGVHWCKARSTWRAAIRCDRVDLHLGSFADKFEAICARKSAENKYDFHENHGAH